MKNKYSRHLFYYLDYSRVLNAIKVYAAYLLSTVFKIPLHGGFPLGISVEPAGFCNLRCPECPAGRRELSRDKGLMQLELFKHIISQVSHKTTYLTLYFQGEPFLNPVFFDMVKYAASRKMFVATSTNGHFLDMENAEKVVDSGLSRLIISMDGTTQESYAAYRIGGNLEKVMEGIMNVQAARKKLASCHLEIVVQFLVTRQNEQQMEDMKKLSANLGADKLVFKSAQVYDFENGSEMIPLSSKYARYKKTASGKYEIKNKLSNRCRRLWFYAVITWDGQLLPCCFDKDAKYAVANLENTAFKEAWFGNEMRAFRKKLLHSRKHIDICQNCTEGTASTI